MGGVERTEADKSVPRGSVRATSNLFGERVVGVKPERKKTQMQISENLPSKERELHLVKRTISRFNTTTKSSETVKARAEFELSNSRKIVDDLTLQIKKSKANSKLNRLEFQDAKYPEQWESDVNRGNDQCVEVLRELQIAKEELSRLKLNMASVIKQKSEAEKSIEGSISKAKSGSSTLESLREVIEEVNEEQGFVELARIQAVKEFEEIESQRESEYAQFSTIMEKNRKKIKNLNREVRYAKDLELNLAVTNSDLEVLQNELKLVKEMEKINSEIKSEGLPGKLSFLREEISRTREEESATSSLLHLATAELIAAKRELQSIREEGFQVMASMDVIRNEINPILKEIERFKKLEEKEESTAQELNLKLRRAKSKLDAATRADGKSKAILANLLATLQQLETDKEVAVREKEAIDDENLSLKLEIQKKESEAYVAEERLQNALQELEAVKTVETMTLDTLKSLTEKTMKARASSSLHTSTITISNFEYDYLSRRADRADQVANKKVAAAQAWIEAIRAKEKEILMKTEIYQREIRELSMVEEKEKHETEKFMAAKNAVEGELNIWMQEKVQDETKNLQLEVTFPRKSTKDNSISRSSKRNMIERRPPSPGTPFIIRSSSISLKKKKKVIPNLEKFLNNEKAKKKAWKQDGNPHFRKV